MGRRTRGALGLAMITTVALVGCYAPVAAAKEPPKQAALSGGNQPSKGARPAKRKRMATIEVVDTEVAGPKRSVRSARILVALTPREGSSRIRARDGDHTYELKASAREDDGTTLTLFLALSRHEGVGPPVLSVDVNSRVPIGKRAKLAKVVRSDGGHTEVMVTVH